MIPESFIQELLARTDIVEIIDRVVPLKKPAPITPPVVHFTKRSLPRSQ